MSAGNDELWQLVGYALADAGDHFGIGQVGVAALRWRRRWTIGIDDLLERLAGQRVTLDQARDEFAAALRPLTARARRSRGLARRRRPGELS
jgi:hypothetical protein